MKQKFFIALLFISISFHSTGVFAQTPELLDVFEEYATMEDVLFETETFSISTNKNTPVEDTLRYVAEEENIRFEITTPPKKGTVSITGEQGTFLYTPFQDQTGTDHFSFRIVTDDKNSNISTCMITILDSTPPSETPDTPVGFLYEDLQGHWVNYSAQKLVERDVLKGERVGNKYYFYPDTPMRRIDVIRYILAALGKDPDAADSHNTHIFADSSALPEAINRAAYVAHELGIVDGTREGEAVFLRPYAYIKRVELIKMIDQAMRSKTRSDVAFDDYLDHGSVPDWAVQHVKNLLGYGIIKGFEDQTLRPFSELTKAETAEMLYQMIKYNEANAQETLSMRIKSEFYGKIVA